MKVLSWRSLICLKCFTFPVANYKLFSTAVAAMMASPVRNPLEREYSSIYTAAASNLISRIQSGVIKIPFTAREIYHGRHWTGLSKRNRGKGSLGISN